MSAARPGPFAARHFFFIIPNWEEAYPALWIRE